MSQNHDDSYLEEFLAFERMAYFLAFLLTIFDVKYLTVFLFLFFCFTGFLIVIYFTVNCSTERLLPRYQHLTHITASVFAFGFEKWLMVLVLFGVPLDLWMGWNVLGHMAFMCFLFIVLPVTSTVRFLGLNTKLKMPGIQESKVELKKKVADELKEVKKAKAELGVKYIVLSSELSNTKSRCQSVEAEHVKCKEERRQFLEELQEVKKAKAELEEKYAALRSELSTTKSRCQIVEKEHGKCEFERWQLLVELNKEGAGKLQEVKKAIAELEEKYATLNSELSTTKSRCQTVEAEHRKCEEERQQLRDELNKGVDKLEEVMKAKAELDEKYAALCSELSTIKSVCQTVEAEHRKCEEERQKLLDELKRKATDELQEVKKANVELQKRCRQLEAQNATLSSMLHCSKESLRQTLKAERCKCEEERQELLEELKKATHASEIYRGLLHDLALDNRS